MMHDIIVGVCLLCLATFCTNEILSFFMGFLLLIGYLKFMTYKSLVVQSLTVGLIGWATLLPYHICMCWPRVHALSIPGSAIAAIVTTRVSNSVLHGVMKKRDSMYAEPHDNL
tara:strand:- start:79 stop:417 length:339 start_codon:yes stop_codon:yes gene_type:complete